MTCVQARDPRMDTFVRGLLYLDLDQVAEAVKAFLSLQSTALVEFCVQSPHLLLPETNGNNDDIEDNPSNPLDSSNDPSELMEPSGNGLCNIMYTSDPYLVFYFYVM